MARWIVPLLLLCSGCSAARLRERHQPSSCGGIPQDAPAVGDDCTSQSPLRVVAGCPPGTHLNAGDETCLEGSEPIALAFDDVAGHAPKLRELARLGAEYFHAQDYEQAKQHFAMAYEQTRYYEYAFALASSERALGRLVAALELFRAIALAEPMTGERAFERTRHKSEAAIAELEKRVGKLRVVVIENEAGGDAQLGPEFTLDSQRLSLDVVSVGLEVDPGRHAIAVWVPCHEPARYEVLVAEGGSSDSSVNLSYLRPCDGIARPGSAR